LSEGRKLVTLRDVGPTDVSWVSLALGSWQCTERWSSAWGRTPAPDLLTLLLWQGVAWQKAAKDSAERPLGIFQLANPDLGDGFGNLELLVDPSAHAEVDRALAEFVGEVFGEFQLRKLSVAAAADNLLLPPCLADRVRHAGTLREHHRRGADDYVDVNLYEVWAESW
jgi:hypothetical protein